MNPAVRPAKPPTVPPAIAPPGPNGAPAIIPNLPAAIAVPNIAVASRPPFTKPSPKASSFSEAVLSIGPTTREPGGSPSIRSGPGIRCLSSCPSLRGDEGSPIGRDPGGRPYLIEGSSSPSSYP